MNFSASQILSIYEKYIFSGFSNGLISAFQYGVSLTNALITILGLSLANVFWPRFLDHAASNDRELARRDISLGMRWMFLGMGVICCAIYINSDILIHYIYVRGAFDETSALKTSQALRATIFTALPVTAVSILGRALISFGMAKSSMFIGLVSALSGMAVLWLAKFMGLYELAMSHWLIGNTIGLFVGTILFLRFCDRPFKSYIAILWLGCRILVLGCASVYLAPLISKNICADCTDIWFSLLSTMALLIMFLSFAWVLRLIPNDFKISLLSKKTERVL